MIRSVNVFKQFRQLITIFVSSLINPDNSFPNQEVSGKILKATAPQTVPT